jgi:hypothetical protein
LFHQKQIFDKGGFMENELVREEVILEVVEDADGDVVFAELIDIEEYAKRGERPPRAKNYRFRVDDHHYTTEKSELTGRQVLAFAAKTPDSYHLRLRVHGQVRTIAPDDVVDLREHHLERFTTIPRENTDGENR